jgi:hypothetical protein
MMADRNGFRLGAGGGYGLQLDDELWHGTSQRCETFNNHPLCGSAELLSRPVPSLFELQRHYGIQQLSDPDDEIAVEAPTSSTTTTTRSCSGDGTTPTTPMTSVLAAASDAKRRGLAASSTSTPGGLPDSNDDDLYQILSFESMIVELYGFH